MSPSEIRDAIGASPALKALATAGNLAGVAAALSEDRTRPTDAEIGNGLILEVLGIERGNVLLDLIAQDANLRHVRPLLEQGRLRVSSALVAGWLQGLVLATKLTQEEADAVTALGRGPDPVSEFDVRCACWSDDGELLV